MLEILVKDTSQLIELGHNGDNNATRLLFPIVDDWQRIYGGGGTFTILMKRPRERGLYPKTTTVDGINISCVAELGDVQNIGNGNIVIRYTVGDTVVNSDVYRTVIKDALGEVGDVPPGYQDWVQHVLDAAATAEEAVLHYPYVNLETNTWMRWDIDHFVDTGVQATGDKGDQGDKGDPGYTPVKGIDYFTPEDISQIESEVEEFVTEGYRTAAEQDDIDDLKADKTELPDMSKYRTSVEQDVIDASKVQDVKINDISIKGSDGVVDIRQANSTSAGVIKTSTSGLNGISPNLSDGELRATYGSTIATYNNKQRYAFVSKGDLEHVRANDSALKQDKLIAGSNINIADNGKTISAVVPTKVSQLLNDSNYITTSYLDGRYRTETEQDIVDAQHVNARKQQYFTAEEKAQARRNIDAVSSSEVDFSLYRKASDQDVIDSKMVNVSHSQSFDTDEKHQARSNIDAVGIKNEEAYVPDIYLQAPNGIIWKLTLDNNGLLQTTESLIDTQIFEEQGIEIQDVELKSPDGSIWILSVDNDGILYTGR